MNPIRQYATLVKWEWLREAKGFDTIVSMVLFAAITLMVLSYAIDPRFVATKALPFLEGAASVAPLEGGGAEGSANPSEVQARERAILVETMIEDIRYRLRAGLLWITVLLAGAIGIERAFRGGQDEKVLQGILVAPVSRSTLYYAKLTSTFLFVVIMEALVFGLFAFLFNVSLSAEVAAKVFAVLVAGSLGYVAVGVTLSAMMRSVKGGEVMLRILLFPLMIPLFAVSVDATRLLLAGEPVTLTATGQGVNLRHLGLLLGADLLYVCAGQVLFEVVMAEYDLN